LNVTSHLSIISLLFSSTLAHICAGFFMGKVTGVYRQFPMKILH
jgi:hypothetical protein